MHFDIYTLIFAGLAIFVVIKLRSVLGTRTGQEKPPHDPFAPREPNAANGAVRDNVVPLPRNGELASRSAGNAGGSLGRRCARRIGACQGA